MTIKKVILIILGFISIIALVIIYTSLFIYIKFGPIKTNYPNMQSYRSHLLIESADPNPRRIIVIYPANLVDASQYLSIANYLTHKTSAHVIVIRPKFRLSNLAGDFENYIPYYLKSKDLPIVLIGHSGGAAAACKASANLLPHIKVIAVNGYCNSTLDSSVSTIVGSNDHLLMRMPSYVKNDLVTVKGGAHFMMTGQNISTKTYESLIEQLVNTIVRD